MSTQPGVMAPFYLLACRECGNGDLVIPFGSAEARGHWAVAHTAGTGHDRWWAADFVDGKRVFLS